MYIKTCPVNKSDLTQADAYLARLSYLLQNFFWHFIVRSSYRLLFTVLRMMSSSGDDGDPLSPDSLLWLGKHGPISSDNNHYFLNSFENSCW